MSCQYSGLSTVSEPEEIAPCDTSLLQEAPKIEVRVPCGGKNFAAVPFDDKHELFMIRSLDECLPFFSVQLCQVHARLNWVLLCESLLRQWSAPLLHIGNRDETLQGKKR